MLYKKEIKMMKTKHPIHQLKLILLFMISIGYLSSCKEFLEAKPDKALAIPQSLTDVTAMLDYTVLGNSIFRGELASDNVYFTLADFNAISAERDRNTFIWQSTALDGDGGGWASKYNSVFVSNVALETLANITPQTPAEQAEWNRLKGTALFIRGYAFFELLSHYAAVYEATTADEKLGIPLKLRSDINDKQARASLAASYQQVQADLKEALKLLPLESTVATRPNKKSTYALLSRVYMAMALYPQAGLYADSCLNIYAELLDFNTINATATAPFSRFNKEVIYHGTGVGSGLVPGRYRVDTLLYDSYSNQDIRKTAFFRRNGVQNYTFKGGFDGVVSSVYFSGLTTGELYLNKAESKARAGQIDEAMQALNQLKKHRYQRNGYTDFEATTAADALNIILAERRKELLYRGIRWTDLKRLQLEPAYRKTLVRVLGANRYELAPNASAYVFQIPQQVIDLSGITQN